jgi:Virulence-associated protein E
MSAVQAFQSQYERASSSLLANLPGALSLYDSWVVWKEEPPSAPGKKNKKLPLDARSLSAGDWNNREHWSSRAVAMQSFLKNPTLKGIGFVFSNTKNGDPYTFFDLDGVVQKGKLLPWAQEFVTMVNSYTEISPSGTGIKSIIRAKLGGRGCSFEFTDSKGKVHEIECYDASRFFAATGNRLEGTPETICDGQELLDTLHPPTEEEEKSGPPIDRATDEYAADVDAIPDDKLLEKILASKQKAKFKSLWEGNTTGYAGYFAASGALSSILAFWTRANPERIDRLYRQSGLFEKDWWEADRYAGKKSRCEYVIDAACKKAAAKDMYVPSSSGLIVNDDGRIKPIMANAITMLKTTPRWDGVLAFNKLTLYAMKLKPAPWEEHSSGQWTDFDDTKLEEWFQRHRLFIDSSKKAGEAAQAVAHENAFHPVRDYLESLKWDDTPRLDSWLINYLGVKDDEYTRAVGRCWMISAVARIFRPGCQADYTLLLEGNQGILKSSALRALAGDEFFLDNVVDIEGKDALLKIHGAWIVELEEFAGVKRSDVDKVKAFLTCRTDRFRAPYDRRVQIYPRMNVFAASNNGDTPFTDETGNRRFWPVRCEKIAIEKIRAERNQLWAEAVTRFRKGDHWWLDTSALNVLAEKEQAERYRPGAWDGIIERWLENPTQRIEYKDGGIRAFITPWNSSADEVTVEDVLLHAVGKSVAQWTHSDEHSVSKCLKTNHWKRVSIWDPEKKKPRRVYQRPTLTGADLKGNL